MRSKIINDQWEKCKDFLPFGELNQKSSGFDNNSTVNLDDVISFKHDRPEFGNASFDIQPDTNNSLIDDLRPIKTDFRDSILTPKLREDQNRREFIRRIYDIDPHFQPQTTKGWL